MVAKLRANYLEFSQNIPSILESFEIFPPDESEIREAWRKRDFFEGWTLARLLGGRGAG